jgi:hypothetical protein
VLVKPDELTDDERAELRRHPELGAAFLAQYDDIDPLIVRVAREHHERLDGSGYPDGLRGEAVHVVSRLCAVVDAFDAMTACRPFRDETMSAADAMDALDRETPGRYDADVVETWTRLLDDCAAVQSGPGVPFTTATPAEPNGDRRGHPRIATRLGGRLHALEPAADGWHERAGVQVVVHNISHAGVGLLSRRRIVVGESVHLYMRDRGQDAICLGGEVVRSVLNRDGWYEVGVHFNEPLTDLHWVARLAASLADRAA